MANNKHIRKTANLIRQIANERIEKLFSLIEKKEYSFYRERYIKLAFDIGMRYRVHIPPKYKHRICKFCNSYLFYGSNSRVRLKKKYKLITCFSCSKSMHFPYK